MDKTRKIAKFTCPECGQHEIEAVVTDARKVMELAVTEGRKPYACELGDNPVTVMSGEGDDTRYVTYSESQYGEVESTTYRCANCHRDLGRIQDIVLEYCTIEPEPERYVRMRNWKVAVSLLSRVTEMLRFIRASDDIKYVHKVACRTVMGTPKPDAMEETDDLMKAARVLQSALDRQAVDRS